MPPVASLLKVLSLAALLVPAVIAPARAGDPSPAGNPVLATMIKTGAKLYYLGSRDGLDGWFIVKDGQVQIAYSQPKSQQAILGALFGPEGENITSSQVQNFLNLHPDVSTALTLNAGSSTAAIAAAVSQATAGVVPQGGVPMQAGVLPPTVLPSGQAVATAQVPAASGFASPGERLLNDLQNAAGVSLGAPSAPVLTMIMDPDCLHCKATWKALRDTVLNNKLQIRMIPIAVNAEPERERAAAQMLHLLDPLNSFDKWVAGDKTQLAGPATPLLLDAIHANRALVDSWHIQATPFLVYRGKDGKVKILQGEPDKVSSLLSDLLP